MDGQNTQGRARREASRTMEGGFPSTADLGSPGPPHLLSGSSQAPCQSITAPCARACQRLHVRFSGIPMSQSSSKATLREFWRAQGRARRKAERPRGNQNGQHGKPPGNFRIPEPLGLSPGPSLGSLEFPQTSLRKALSLVV